MRLTKTLIWPAALTMLASCGLISPTVDPGCAGWRPIRVADATVDHLAANDPQTLAALIAHHEAGQARGCWR
jgi:hypothetical protein